MGVKFLKSVKFSKMAGFWKKPKSANPFVFFIWLNVICSNYGFICKSEEFYRKENWRKFETFLLEEGW